MSRITCYNIFVWGFRVCALVVAVQYTFLMLNLNRYTILQLCATNRQFWGSYRKVLRRSICACVCTQERDLQTLAASFTCRQEPLRQLLLPSSLLRLLSVASQQPAELCRLLLRPSSLPHASSDTSLQLLAPPAHRVPCGLNVLLPSFLLL